MKEITSKRYSKTQKNFEKRKLFPEKRISILRHVSRRSQAGEDLLFKGTPSNSPFKKNHRKFQSMERLPRASSLDKGELHEFIENAKF